MRGITLLNQTIKPLLKHHIGFPILRLPGKMGRAASKTKAKAEGVSELPSIPESPSIKDVPADRTTRKRQKGDASEGGAYTNTKTSRGYFDGPSQEAASVSAEAPQTPAEPTERRSRRRAVRLAREDILAASIPQQVAAVATLPTVSGQHTFQEAPVAVWSMELMTEAAAKLSAADSCKSCNKRICSCAETTYQCLPCSSLTTCEGWTGSSSSCQSAHLWSA